MGRSIPVGYQSRQGRLVVAGCPRRIPCCRSYACARCTEDRRHRATATGKPRPFKRDGAGRSACGERRDEHGRYESGQRIPHEPCIRHLGECGSLAHADGNDPFRVGEHDVHGRRLHSRHAAIRTARRRQVLLSQLVYGFDRASGRNARGLSGGPHAQSRTGNHHRRTLSPAVSDRGDCLWKTYRRWTAPA
jgi:hypothetical protein